MVAWVDNMKRYNDDRSTTINTLEKQRWMDTCTDWIDSRYISNEMDGLHDLMISIQLYPDSDPSISNHTMGNQTITTSFAKRLYHSLYLFFV
jgi:hypothetical protein